MMKYISGMPKYSIFICAFLFARIPVWFLVISLYLMMITPAKCFALIVCIFICRRYIESEIFGLDFINQMKHHFLRLIITILSFILIYFSLIYLGIFADIYDKLLIIAALILAVILFYDTSGNKVDKNPIYGLPFIQGVLVTLLWLYIAFVPDSIIGNISILTAIYIIEFYYLISNHKNAIDIIKN